MAPDFDRFALRPAATRPTNAKPTSATLPGSGSTLGESTPDRNTIGGRLTVLPLSPHARKLSRSVVASAVSVTETNCQGVTPPEGVLIFWVATMSAVGSASLYTPVGP